MHIDNKNEISVPYRIPESNQILELSSSVLQIFKNYRQASRCLEAGGLLFAEFCLPTIIIKEATIPNKRDKRRKYSFIPCKDTQNKLISHRFRLGLHFVGEWHTHPEHTPSPSKLDLDSMYDSFVKSKHELNAFVMIIVGSLKSELCLWISLHNKNGFIRLEKL